MIHSFFKLARSFWWNKSVRRWAIIGVLAYKAIVAAAQDVKPEIEPVYVYPFNQWDQSAREYAWQANNTLAIGDIMRNPDTGAETPLTVTYDPYGPRDSSVITLPPALPNHVPSHVQLLPPTYNTPFATSPNGRFDLYTVDYYYKARDRDVYYPGQVLGIVDRETGQFITLPEVSFFRASFHDLQWNSSGNTFLLSLLTHYGVTPVYVHVTGFTEDITQAKSTPIVAWGAVSEEFPFSMYVVYDVDSTGRYLLADGYFPGSSWRSGSMSLLVIDMEDFSYEVVAQNKFFDAARFAQPDDREVVYMNEYGAFAYDRQKKIQTLLTTEINASHTLAAAYRDYYPSFSPDGHYLVTQLKDDEVNLYVYPIPPAP
jgi:hypothetical protein